MLRVPPTSTMYSQPASKPAGVESLNAGVLVAAFHTPLNTTAPVRLPGI